MQLGNFIRYIISEFWIKLGSKNKSINEISRMLFSNMDFNFPYFAHFNFVHFEIEKLLD